MVSAQSSCKEQYNHLVQPPCSGWSCGLGEVLTVTHRLNGTLQNRKACKNHHTFISVYAWQAPGAASERHDLLISNFPCWAGLSAWQLFSVCLLNWWPGGSRHAGRAQMSGFKVTGVCSPFLPLSSFQQMPLLIPWEYSLLFTSHPFSLPLTHLGRLSPVPRSHARRRKEGAWHHRALTLCQALRLALTLYASNLTLTPAPWGAGVQSPATEAQSLVTCPKPVSKWHSCLRSKLCSPC